MRLRKGIGLLLGLCVLWTTLSWAEPDPGGRAPTDGSSHFPYALPIAAGVFVVLWGATVAGVVTWNRAIKRKVRERTEALEIQSDQLRVANEEAEVANEELQTQSEELESLNEELSITNEDLEKKAQELSTSNEALKAALRQQKKDHDQITFLANIVESATESVIATDVEGRVIYVNPATERIFGYAADELIGQPAGKLNAARSAPDQEEEILRETLKEGWEGELTDRRKDGEIFPFWTTTSKIIDEEGKLIALVGIGRDITERKYVEEALKKSEEKYRNLVESLEEGIGIVDENETFTFVNRATAQIFGYSKEELIGKNIRELTPPEAFQRVLEQSSIRRTGESSEYELVVLRKDGASRIIMLTATPIIGDDGRYRGSFGLFRDITERKRAENRLAVVRKITRTVNASLDIQEVYHTFLAQVAELVAFDRSEITMLDASGEALIPLAYVFDVPPWQNETKVLLEGTGIEWTFEHLEPMLEPDLKTERRFPESQGLFEGGSRSHVILPLIHKGKGIGALSLASRKRNAYSEEDVSILDQIAGQIATSVRNMQLFEETRQRAEYLEGLYQVGMAICSELDLD
ncbi:MAG: PAS domain S-box protein, partial [Candidatus Latescibacteria bacterium]|nr:PAS domain S-box protein [Candidatus Latescibacterota bacterium]